MPCKPITLCSSLLSSQKKDRQSSFDLVVEPTQLRRGDNVERRSRGEAAAAKFGDGKEARQAAQATAKKGKKLLRRSSSQVLRDFLRATAGASEGVFTDPESLPTCEEAYARFREMYPRFADTAVLDELRQQEYSHLEETRLACLDYCGFGLFSQLQQLQQWESASFSLAEISANLCSHALFGTAREGTMECDVRRRIMEYLNIPEPEYSMVFTASRGATFKLLADAYPWESSGRLVTMYDYESESVGWMEERARERGARVSRARFRWPSLRVCSRELRKELAMAGKKRRRRRREASAAGDGGAKGLFVFPVQSRVSGSKYSYQWMATAQQRGWHVLLDASAIAPKDMDSLGLSLFRPDFIIASFYKLFGSDPSGFACLFLKNSVCQTLQDPSGAPGSGMVRIIPFPCEWPFSSNGSSSSGNSTKGASYRRSVEHEHPQEGGAAFEFLHRSHDQVVSSFSGPMLDYGDSDDQRPHDHVPGIEDDCHRSVFQDNEIASVGGVSRSPVFSEDGIDNLFCIELGPSPLGTASRTSVSEDAFSGPIRSSPVQCDDDDNDSDDHHTWPKNPPVSPSHRFSAKKDSHSCISTRSRIKDLCSGLLHLHTGRVVNSVEGTGEDCRISKDGNKGLHSIKTSAPSYIEPLDQPKSVLTETRPSEKQSTTGENGLLEDDMPDRVVLLLRKIGKDQPTVENEDVSVGFQGKEHCMDSMMVVGGEFVYPKGEESHEDRSGPIGGLETIAEMDAETDYCTSQEQDCPGADMVLSQKNELSLTSEIKESGPARELPGIAKENMICRETEGNFRLLGRRNGDRFSLGKVFSASLAEQSFSPFKSKDFGSDFEIRSDEEFAEQDMVVEEEPQLLCRSLDHADLLGLNKTSCRLRCLTNWLISSLLSLRHPHNDLSLVRIYGPQVRYDRGASFAFNLFDSEDKVLHPDLVRMLADQTNVSLGLGFLQNICFSGNENDGLLMPGFPETKSKSSSVSIVSSKVEVVTAALGLLSDFEDVYRMWAFVSRFLDPDFVARELGHPMSLS